MGKKIWLILIGVIFILVTALSLFFNFNFFSPSSPAFVKPQIKEENSSLQFKTKTWEDPAGFSFEYNENLKVDNHPEDEVNYANLELTDSQRKGKMTILVYDFPFEDLNEWLTKDSLIRKGNALDTMVAGLKAKKVALDNKIFTGFYDQDKVFYLLILNPEEDETFWRKQYEILLTSFKLIPFEGEKENSQRLKETQTTGSQTTEKEENVIYEEEEVIE